MDGDDDILALPKAIDPLNVSSLSYRLPAFLKGQSHAIPGDRQRRSEMKKKRNWKNLSPIPKKGGPSSMIGIPTQLPNDLDKFYKDLSGSGSDEDVAENLDKLKSLFRGSNLGQQYSRPVSRRDLLE